MDTSHKAAESRAVALAMIAAAKSGRLTTRAAVEILNQCRADGEETARLLREFSAVIRPRKCA